MNEAKLSMGNIRSRFKFLFFLHFAVYSLYALKMAAAAKSLRQNPFVKILSSKYRRQNPLVKIPAKKMHRLIRQFRLTDRA